MKKPLTKEEITRDHKNYSNLIDKVKENLIGNKFRMFVGDNPEAQKPYEITELCLVAFEGEPTHTILATDLNTIINNSSINFLDIMVKFKMDKSRQAIQFGQFLEINGLTIANI